jgi:hypothetical protein
MPEQSFDFLEEVQKSRHYHALFPDEKAVRAILWLYSKITSGAFAAEKFKVEDIYQAFQETNQEGEYSRVPWERIHAHTAILQEYFLLYNEQEKLYSLRDYGRSFCKHAEEALAGNFNPTNIEIICKDLLNSLRGVTDKKTLLGWLDIKFDAFKPKMSSQVEFLDRKINLAVSEIRNSAQLQSGEVLETLKKVDAHLEQVREYNKELRYAFTSLKDITTALEDRISLADDNQILDKLSQVQQFFPDIRYRLDLIDKRLDKLQPRFRQFFGALNKPLFNTKVESFLRLLLKSSSVKTDGVRKNIAFPLDIPPIRLNQLTTRFTIVERKEDLFPAISRKNPTYEETEETRRTAFKKLNAKILQQDSIEAWIQRILNDCRVEKAVSYSEYFIKMVNQQEGDIDLAARVTHRLMKIAAFSKEISLTIDKNILVNYNNIKVWEMRIISR